MFKLSKYFNVKCDLAEGAAAPGGEPSTTAVAPVPEAAPSLLDGQPAPEATAAPEPFLAALPEEGDTEGWAQVYAKLGRPDSADGYELKAPEGDDGEFLKTTSEWMHKAGLNKQQAQVLAENWNTYQQQQAESMQVAIQKQAETDLTTIRQEWGANFDANKAVMSQAVQTFAPPEFIEMLDKSGLINNPVIAKMFLKIGEAIGEDKSVSAPKNSPLGGEDNLAQRLWPGMS